MSDPRALLAKVRIPQSEYCKWTYWFGKADKKAESRSGFFGGGGSSKYEEAAELYTQAANAFRLQKMGIQPSLLQLSA